MVLPVERQVAPLGGAVLVRVAAQVATTVGAAGAWGGRQAILEDGQAVGAKVAAGTTAVVAGAWEQIAALQAGARVAVVLVVALQVTVVGLAEHRGVLLEAG